MTEAEVVEVMEAELRVPWEDVFESIDPSRSPPARSARCTPRRSRAATASSSRSSGRRGRGDMRDLGLLELFAEKAEHRDGSGGSWTSRR